MSKQNKPTINLIPDKALRMCLPELPAEEMVEPEVVAKILAALLEGPFAKGNRSGGYEVWAHAVVDALMQKGFGPVQLLRLAEFAFDHLANPHKTASGAANLVRTMLDERGDPIVLERVEIRSSVWRFRRRRVGE